MSTSSVSSSAPPTTTGEASETETPDFTTTIISTILPTSTQTVYDRDPYLDYQPAFAYSLPMQFLLTGVILALSTILLIHLVFTAPYHWPLAKLNYGLQLAGVISLLLSLGITLSVILGNALETSREWPYMLNYVAVDIPLRNWTQLDSGWWYTLDAVTSGLAHTTHIQFLTILYPSSIEERLIFGLLGPLVLASSLSSFITLSPSAGTRSVAESIKNICNSALAILFSVALWAWGLIINRKEAWRTDGGTAIFGGGALALSLFSIALNLYQIAKVPPVWIPPLLWAVVLWQSFLGWWWYVGSAAPEPHPRLRKRKKRNTVAANADGGGEGARLSRVRNRLGLTDGLRRRNGGDGESSMELTRTDSISSQFASSSSTSRMHVPAPARRPGRWQTFNNYFPSLPLPLTAWWHRLRQEHMNAREQQAAENEQKRFDVYGYVDESGRQSVRGVPGSGWGLGSFALTNRRRAAEERAERGNSGVEDEHEMDDMGNRSDAGGTGPRETPLWGDEEDVERRPRRQQRVRPAGREELSTPGTSWSWMGPFRRWRLRDATVY